MLVLLDRDGVINVDLPTSVRSLEEFKLLPRALEGIRLLSDQGVHIAIATNQAAVGRGDMSYEALEAIHTFLCQQVTQAGGRIDHIFVCTDTQVEPHNRRKPAPGMLLEAMDMFGATPDETVFIGDADRDMEAAARAGCAKILLRSGKGEKTLTAWQPHWGASHVYADLYEAAQALVQQDRKLLLGGLC